MVSASGTLTELSQVASPKESHAYGDSVRLIPAKPSHDALIDVSVTERISDDKQVRMQLQCRAKFNQQIEKGPGGRELIPASKNHSQLAPDAFGRVTGSHDFLEFVGACFEELSVAKTGGYLLALFAP